MSDTTTRRLSDRELATVIDALQIAREKIKANGGRGDDCQSALDQLYDGLTPATDGLTYMLGQRSSLIDVSEEGWLTRAMALVEPTTVNERLSLAVEQIAAAGVTLGEMMNRALDEGRTDDARNLVEQMAVVSACQRHLGALVH